MRYNKRGKGLGVQEEGCLCKLRKTFFFFLFFLRDSGRSIKIIGRKVIKNVLVNYGRQR